MLYILRDKVPVLASDLLEWATWFETADRVVKQEQIGPCFVSTVFLGIDHNFFRGSAPLLFETMVFSHGTSNDLWQERASTWELALECHQRGVEWAKANIEAKPE